jgi:hypothetical protein
VVEGLVGVERRPLASLQPLDGKAEPHQGGTAPPA